MLQTKFQDHLTFCAGKDFFFFFLGGGGGGVLLYLGVEVILDM